MITGSKLQMVYYTNKTNHTFIGTAEYVYKEQDLSTFDAHCGVIKSFFFKQNIFQMDPHTHIKLRDIYKAPKCLMGGIYEFVQHLHRSI